MNYKELQIGRLRAPITGPPDLARMRKAMPYSCNRVPESDFAGPTLIVNSLKTILLLVFLIIGAIIPKVSQRPLAIEQGSRRDPLGALPRARLPLLASLQNPSHQVSPHNSPSNCFLGGRPGRRILFGDCPNLWSIGKLGSRARGLLDRASGRICPAAFRSMIEIQ